MDATLNPTLFTKDNKIAEVPKENKIAEVPKENKIAKVPKL